MVAIEQPQYITAAEYMEQELKALEKSEYFAGVVVAMSGASLNHNRISMDVGFSLMAQLKGTDCKSFAMDVRVYIPSDHYFYPDVGVICGDPEIHKIAGGESIINPVVIVETLSLSTEYYDRSSKLIAYQLIPTLQHYLLVSQNAPQVEMYTRMEGGWFYTLHKGLDSEIALSAIHCSLKLADIYARLNFEDSTNDPSPDKTC